MLAPVTTREAIARAIYMTHWALPEESLRGLDPRTPPLWENVSEPVREWVLAQADSVLTAMLRDERLRAWREQTEQLESSRSREKRRLAASR